MITGILEKNIKGTRYQGCNKKPKTDKIMRNTSIASTTRDFHRSGYFLLARSLL